MPRQPSLKQCVPPLKPEAHCNANPPVSLLLQADFPLAQRVSCQARQGVPARPLPSKLRKERLVSRVFEAYVLELIYFGISVGGVTCVTCLGCRAMGLKLRVPWALRVLQH